MKLKLIMQGYELRVNPSAEWRKLRYLITLNKSPSVFKLTVGLNTSGLENELLF
jgi:hypothetical protein